MRHFNAVALLLAILLITQYAAAHEDMIAPLVKVEKVYTAPKPLGQLRVTYSAPQDAQEQALLVECDLFRGRVPAHGLVDLPRPDWDRFYAAYSLTSFESGKWIERPYVYIQVLLNGPAGKAWEQTWATFHFDANGKLVRRIKRFIPDAATKSVHIVWKEWQIGSNISAEAVLESAKDE